MAMALAQGSRLNVAFPDLVGRHFAPGTPRRWYVAGMAASAVGSWLEFAGEPTSGRQPPQYTQGVVLRTPTEKWVSRVEGWHCTAIAYALGEAVMVTPRVVTLEDIMPKTVPNKDVIVGIGQGALRVQVGSFDAYEGAWPQFQPLPDLLEVVAGPSPIDELKQAFSHAQVI